MALDADLDIIVVDNASGDGSLDTITSALAQAAPACGYSLQKGHQPPAFAGTARWLRIASSGRNGGYAFGNNIGARMALADPACEFVWILNSDTRVPDRSALEVLVDKMDSRPDIGICGSTVVYMESPETVQTLGGGTFDVRWGRCAQLGQGQPRSAGADEEAVEATLAYVNGACAFVRRAFFETVGFMDEGFFLYYEEIDWSLGGLNQFKIGYCAESVIEHSVGASIGTRDGGQERSPLSTYYLTKSRLRFLRRRSPASLPLAYLDVVREIAQHIKRRRWTTARAMIRAATGMANAS
jgi:GT2 family glycosyltransferase